MGQKVNPHGLRVGVIKGWDTRWYADKNTFSEYLVEDKKIRTFVKKECFNAGVTNIEIERKGSDKTMIIINAAKPGILIGRQGAGIEDFKKKLLDKFKKNYFVDIREVKTPDTSAQLVAESIASQLEKRISFRRAMKQSMMRTMKAGAKGIKTQVAGRLGGAEIARTEHYHEGTIPLQTLRADIDYGFAEANTTYGRIGVKVWVYKGEILTAKKKAVITEEGGED
jgi:small subunit ribosomal protein S3